MASWYFFSAHCLVCLVPGLERGLFKKIRKGGSDVEVDRVLGCPADTVDGSEIRRETHL